MRTQDLALQVVRGAREYSIGAVLFHQAVGQLLDLNVTDMKCLDEHLHRANRIALLDPIIEAFWQQRRLLAIRPLNETLHPFPRRFSKGTIASVGFSHSLDPNET